MKEERREARQPGHQDKVSCALLPVAPLTIPVSPLAGREESSGLLLPPKPFTEDEEVSSISDAGSLDSIDSDHEPPPEVEHPMSRIATSAMEDMYTGQHLILINAYMAVYSN